MNKTTTTEHLDGVLVVGGGYAGVHAAKAVMKQGIACTIVDPTGVHGFVTRFAAVAGGTAPTRDLGAPLSSFGASVRRGSVADVDDGVVTLTDGVRLSADAVVIAAGSRTLAPAIDGLEQARRLRLPAEVLSLRDELATVASLVVVGGGPTGVQLAGALSSTRSDMQISVVDSGDRLLGQFHRDLGGHAARVLEGRGVDVRLGTSLEAVTERGMVTADGTEIDGLVVWAGGFESVVDSLGDALPIDEGSIEVDREGRVKGWSQTFAAGDVASHRDKTGARLPMSAQIAVGAGNVAGANAARTAAGKSVRTGSLQHQGWVLDLGGWRGVAEIGPIRLASPGLDRIPPLLHTGIDWKDLLETGGARGMRHAPGLAVDGAAALRLLADRTDVELPLAS